MTKWQIFKNGVFNENPIFRLVLGMCSTLAVTTAVVNGIGMGIATTLVLTGSNVIIALLRKIIPKEIRIPAYVVVIATFTTIVDKTMAATMPDLHRVLGIFIPLIVVNCIVLARAEAFASKHNLVDSTFDGLGMGLGFTLALTLLSFIRELVGTGTLLKATDFGFEGFSFFPEDLGAKLLILPPGAFITLGLLLAGINWLVARKGEK
ncbi:electron transport complex subunit RsxE [Capillibacterium thermochitinicola]|uniref:Ion-translocating oxidoreductase complex subunit E n=1 Tax=Capillibacterium thermochitinicola TaxID=2699427 RepID=A0A8J6LN27_9FIRM|nr:electron transport complex subunit E [Capillibacterium thermochitinicola]MBA2133488.1 electron transport complex subunit E [Capillibacterium thermochitinicola]